MPHSFVSFSHPPDQGTSSVSSGGHCKGGRVCLLIAKYSAGWPQCCECQCHTLSAPEPSAQSRTATKTRQYTHTQRLSGPGSGKNRTIQAHSQTEKTKQQQNYKSWLLNLDNGNSFLNTDQKWRNYNQGRTMLEHRTSEEEEILFHSYIIIMVCNMYMTECVYIYPVSSLHSAHGSKQSC